MLPSDQEELRRLQRELHRLQQENSFIKAATPFACTTDSTDADPIAENVLARRFAVVDFPAPDLA